MTKITISLVPGPEPTVQGEVRSEKSDLTGLAHTFRCMQFRRLEDLRLEFLHLGLHTKRQLTTTLARLRERGDREAVGEGFAGLHQEK